MFSCLDKDAAKVVINDIINDEEKSIKARDFLFSHATVLSYDNVTIFAEEIRNNPNESFESIFEDLNIGDCAKKEVLSMNDIEKMALYHFRENTGDECECEKCSC